jgi:hypothetical protein
MALDDDGTGGTKQSYADIDHADTTSYAPNGISLNANTDPYIAIPSSALRLGVRPGDPGLVSANGGVTSAVVGDIGSPAWGEVSLRTASNLGVPIVNAGWPTGPVIPDSFGPVAATVVIFPNPFRR